MLIGALAMASACSKAGDEAGNGTEAAAPEVAGTTPAAATAPDACTFLAKGDLEQMVGHELRDGEVKDASPGMSQCTFETPTGSATIRTFESPALPDAAGFSSVTLTTFPTTPQTFAESRAQMGAGSPDAPGVGDEAFFSGPAMIYARKGGTGVSIRLYVDQPKTDAGKAKLAEVLTTIGKAATAKL
jgi:hypothetical protein